MAYFWGEIMYVLLLTTSRSNTSNTALIALNLVRIPSPRSVNQGGAGRIEE
jgi:hypothetical protein